MKLYWRSCIQAAHSVSEVHRTSTGISGSLATLLTILLFTFAGTTIASAQSPSLTLTYPNGGEVFHVGTTTTIRWNEVNIGQEVEIEYSENGGGRWRGIDKVDPGVGSISWKIPNRISTTVLVRVITKDERISDVSDMVFEIAADPAEAAILLSPNGGEVWTEGEQQMVTWQLPADAADALLEFSTDNGATWTEVATVPATPAQYQWTIPHIADQEITTARMRVSVAEAVDHFDISDAPFILRPKPIVVTPQPGIILDFPNGGEEFAVDSLVRIAWTSKDVAGNVTIEFSENGGASWSGITTIEVTEGRYSWKVPNRVTKAAMIRIATLDGKSGDTSDAFFAITREVVQPVSELRVVSPNGGEVWAEGEQRQIAWNASPDIAFITIEMTTDGGASWRMIDTVSALQGSYDLVVPASGIQRTLTAMVRLTNLAAPAMTDRSDAAFQIVPHIEAGTEAAADPAAALRLIGITPNPVSAQGLIRWQQPSGETQLTIYSARGELLRTFNPGTRSAGMHSFSIDADTLPAGTYLVELRADGDVVHEWMIVAR
jgi:hypothetical protein